MRPLLHRRRPFVRALGAGALLAIPGARLLAAVGDAAPDLALQTDAGPLRLADQRGKVVYLDFWASWCGPCKHSFPWMNDMQSRYGAKGLQVLAVNLDAKTADAKRFLSENSAQFKVAFDSAGDSAKRFAIKGMPSSVLIGADGRVLATHAGFRDADREPLEAAIRDALARK
ncbi:MAG TPA: TlpA disulfide reductase family protein [Burkholderiaceae bacterium]|nr:TlpA disulfide reductase family protein [Burkholderiaceae bacterium]